MKSKAIVTAITVAALSFGSLSFAQDFGRRGPGHEQRVDNRDRHDNNRFNRHQAGPRGFDNRHVNVHRDARNGPSFGAYGPQQRFHRGDRMPAEYRRHQYVVNDWRARRLHAPGHGQQWVQTGTDYALIAIATGVIAQLVLSNR